MVEKTPVALIVSDLHLSDRTWGSHPDLLGDSYWGLEQVVRRATERQPAVVIAGGDCLDVSRPNSQPVSEFLQALAELQKQDIWFWYIQGQHEFDRPPWLSVSPWGTHLHGLVGEVGPFKIYGLDYQPTAHLPDALQAIREDADVLICHQAWREFMGRDTCQGELWQIPHVPLVFTGDLHQYREATFRGADGRDFRVYSPGATHMRKIDEPEEHYILWLYDDGTVERETLRSRPVIRSGPLSREEQLEEFLVGLPEKLAAADAAAAGLPEALRRPLVQVKFHRDLPQVERRLAAVLNETASLHLQEFTPAAPVGVIGDALPEMSLEQREAVVASGLVGCLSTLVEETDPVYQDLQRLALCPNVRAELQRMYREHLGEA
jgi:hypothetical protein